MKSLVTKDFEVSMFSSTFPKYVQATPFSVVQERTKVGGYTCGGS